MSTDLDQAVYALLTPARFIIDRHGNDGNHTCRCCGQPWPCFELGTAISALDLVLRVHVASRNHPLQQCRPPESASWLTGAAGVPESAPAPAPRT